MRAFLLLLVCFIQFSLRAQNDSLVYGKDFRFAEGIYLTYEQFRTNKPIPKSSIISTYESSRLDFLKMVTSYNSINYRDSSGAEQQVAGDRIWGYSENGAAYIYVHNDFNRITVVGTLCHFTAYETRYVYTGSPVPYGSPYGTPVQQLVQLVLDTETGRVLTFEADVMAKLLERDPALHKEFVSLSKKKKKQSIFIYLRKYNERHPLKFPKG